MIWSKPYTIDDLNNFRGLYRENANTALGIIITEMGEDTLTGTMPVDSRTIQPFGILHGGSSCVLAETLGSVAAWMCIDAEKQRAVGLEIHAHHLRPVSSGMITGVCRPLHRGRTMHLWQIDTFNDEKKMNCTVRLSVAIRNKEKDAA